MRLWNLRQLKKTCMGDRNSQEGNTSYKLFSSSFFDFWSEQSVVIHIPYILIGQITWCLKCCSSCSWWERVHRKEWKLHLRIPSQSKAQEMLLLCCGGMSWLCCLWDLLWHFPWWKLAGHSGDCLQGSYWIPFWLTSKPKVLNIFSLTAKGLFQWLDDFDM